MGICPPLFPSVSRRRSSSCARILSYRDSSVGAGGRLPASMSLGAGGGAAARACSPRLRAPLSPASSPSPPPLHPPPPPLAPAPPPSTCIAQAAAGPGEREGEDPMATVRRTRLSWLLGIVAHARPLVPCITAWCSTCRRAHLLTSSAHMFPCLSAHASPRRYVQNPLNPPPPSPPSSLHTHTPCVWGGS